MGEVFVFSLRLPLAVGTLLAQVIGVVLAIDSLAFQSSADLRSKDSGLLLCQAINLAEIDVVIGGVLSAVLRVRA